MPGRIDVRRIDERAAAIHEGIEDREAAIAINRPSEHISTKRQRRRRETAAAKGPLLDHFTAPLLPWLPLTQNRYRQSPAADNAIALSAKLIYPQWHHG